MLYVGADWTNEQREIISLLTEVSSWATLIGTLFIVLSYIIFKEIRHFHLRLIFFLAIADFTTSIVAALQYSELCSAIWAMSIAFVLDQVIRASNFHVERYEKIFHLLAWFIPAITVVVAYVQDLYSNTGLWPGYHYGVLRRQSA